MITLKTKPQDWPGTSVEWIEYQRMMRDDAAEKEKKQAEAKLEESRRQANSPENKIVRAIDRLVQAIPRETGKNQYELIANQLAVLTKTLAAQKPEDKPKERPRWTFKIVRNDKGNIESIEAERID